MANQAIIEQRKFAEKEHNALTFVGLRAQATAAGLIQLCAELRGAGVLEDGAIDRIKQAIVDDLSVSMPACRRGDEADRALRARMDTIFDRRLKASDARGPIVGSSEQFGRALGLTGRDEAYPEI